MKVGPEMFPSGQFSHDEIISRQCEEFASHWMRGQNPRLEDWLSRLPDDARDSGFTRLLKIDLQQRALQGETVREQDYRQRFPQYAQQLTDVFQSQNSLSWEESHTRSQSSTKIWAETPTDMIAAPVCRPGEAIDRFRLIECVGRGGFGEVWKAFDPELAREVALKFTRPDRMSPDLMARLRLEAKHAASVKHAGIVPVYDIGTSAKGVYIVSEFIRGETMSSRLRRGKPLLDDAVHWTIQLGDALHHAHVRGLVHRDVKPANILLREPSHEAVLTDFGLAVTEIDQLRESVSTVGTWWYMSPEQARGESHRVDARSDIYSLGVVLYQLLTGRLPFVADTREEYLDQLLHRPPRPLRTIDDMLDAELEQICLKCLAKEVAERYTTAADVAAALRQWNAARAMPAESSASVESAPSRAANSRQVSRRILVGLACGVIGIAAGVGFGLGGGNRPPPDRPADPSDQFAVGPVTVLRPPPQQREVEGWTLLLSKEPTVFSWPWGDGRERPRFNRDQRSYGVRSDRTRWIATVGELKPRNFELRALLNINNWIGHGGFIWRLDSNPQAFPEKGYRCLAVEYTRPDAQSPAYLYCLQLDVIERSFDQRLSNSTTIDFLEVQVPTTVTAPLQLQTDDQGIVVRFNGQEWRPNAPSDIDLRPAADVTLFGLTGALGDVEFAELAVRYVP